MMGGVGHSASQHPGPGPLHVEKRRLPFPPRLILVPQRSQALLAVIRVLPHKLQSDFLLRQRRRSDVNSKHGSKPDVFADTLMHHMLVNAASPGIGRVRSDGDIVVGEHAPGANHLDALGLVTLRQKVVSHRQTTSYATYPHLPPPYSGTHCAGCRCRRPLAAPAESRRSEE